MLHANFLFHHMEHSRNVPKGQDLMQGVRPAGYSPADCRPPAFAASGAGDAEGPVAAQVASGPGALFAVKS